jgi:hypothetical protein
VKLLETKMVDAVAVLSGGKDINQRFTFASSCPEE